MNKLLLLAVLLLPRFASADAFDMIFEERNYLDNHTDTYNVIPPASSADALFVYDGAARVGKLLPLAGLLQISGGTVTVAAPASPSQSSASRSLNSAFQISSTRAALVHYSVQITVTASIAGGQNGDVILEIASDVNFTSNVQTVAIAGSGQTYTLAVALQGVQPATNVVAGWVPAAYYARLRTVQNSGTPSFSYRAGQEVLM